MKVAGECMWQLQDNKQNSLAFCIWQKHQIKFNRKSLSSWISLRCNMKGINNKIYPYTDAPVTGAHILRSRIASSSVVHVISWLMQSMYL